MARMPAATVDMANERSVADERSVASPETTFVREENAVEGHGIETVTEDEAHGGGRHDPVRFYGSWTWIVGITFGALLVWMMFALSDAI